MTNFEAGIAALGCLVACSAEAQITIVGNVADAFNAVGTSQEVLSPMSHAMMWQALSAERFVNAGLHLTLESRLSPQLPASGIASFEGRRAKSAVSVSSYLRTTDVSIGGGLVSALGGYRGIGGSHSRLSDYWLGASHSREGVLTMDYAWLGIKRERMAFPGGTQKEDREVYDRSIRLGFRSARLSFQPQQNCVVQLSRGSLSGLDQLVSGEEVRRSAISTTYHQAFSNGDWQLTLAWGRNSRKNQASTWGYLLESALRFNGTHVMFGRMEQVGSDELVRDKEPLQRQVFTLNKLAVGYFHALRPSRSLKLDVGAFVSRYVMPSHMIHLYGDDRTAYMMFMRIGFQ